MTTAALALRARYRLADRPGSLFEQVVAHVSNDLPNFQRFLLDQFRTLESLWAKFLEL